MVNPSLTVNPLKVHDGSLGLHRQTQENLENAELDPKTVPPDRLNARLSKSSQYPKDEPVAKNSREVQYRALYLRAKEDYEKLSKAYLTLKQSHAVPKNVLRGHKVHHNDRLCEAPKERAGSDVTTLENICSPEASQGSSSNPLVSSFLHPTSDSSKPCSLPLAEPRKKDQNLHRCRRTKQVGEETYLDHLQPSDPADQIVRNPVFPQEEPQAKHQCTKSTPKSTGTEDVITPEDKKVCLEECLSKSDSDEPIFISERSVKRKRPAPQDTSVSYGNLGIDVRLKSEPRSSSPQPTLAYQSLTRPNDSIDLDDVGDRTLTPRKRRRVWATSGQTCGNVLGAIDANRRMLPSTSDSFINQQCIIQTPQKSHERTCGTNHGLSSEHESQRDTKTKRLAESKWGVRDYDDQKVVKRSNLPSSSSHSVTERKREEATEMRAPPRNLPLSMLYPEDFRLNPQHNQGLTYAYSEVVRGQDARKCLDGCTRPGCCGNLLRKAIEIGGYIAPQRTRLSSTIKGNDDVKEGQGLLDEYLGDMKSRLSAMSRAEWKELLLQAQTEKFAKQFGKHRCAAYGRASTPPGFWNTDMPTTQEEVENRKCANEMEREKVGTMYREAMRPNGRYMLRD